MPYETLDLAVENHVAHLRRSTPQILANIAVACEPVARNQKWV